ncbi:calmodulin-binding protein 25-like [Amaranthus tricolor]|uniref:calmodulin-binding protein 25-like n=1 Tax=Amaranthus tricolor TaxID=29722 RepID=UPI00258B39BB|nr:calmodulin-binding protein 25-like [Amaranthus tricolor]
MTSTSDWLHFHQSTTTVAGQAAIPYTASSASNFFFSGQDLEPIEPTMSTNITSPPTGQDPLGPSSGRVNKPARKRTRASRRTPTTFLNTDTFNFRAMVQQFTGGPSNNFNIPRPDYGLRPPMGQTQHQILGPLQYSNDNNNMFMQSEGRNDNVNMRLNGPGIGSPSNENRSSHSNFLFQL